MNQTFIYALCDPRDGQIRYIGKSDKPESRYKTHFRKEHSKKSRWIQGLEKLSLKPRLEIIESVPFEEWMFWEQFWIQQLSGWGLCLLNGDRGGLGHYRLFDETKRKIAATLKGRPQTHSCREVHSYDPQTTRYAKTYPSVNSAALEVGGSHSNIVRAIKKRTLAYGFAWSYEKSDTASLPNFLDGRYVAPPEVLAKIAASSAIAQRGRTFTEETKAKMRASALRRWHGEQF